MSAEVDSSAQQASSIEPDRTGFLCNTKGAARDTLWTIPLDLESVQWPDDKDKDAFQEYLLSRQAISPWCADRLKVLYFSHADVEKPLQDVPLSTDYKRDVQELDTEFTIHDVARLVRVESKSKPQQASSEWRKVELRSSRDGFRSSLVCPEELDLKNVYSLTESIPLRMRFTMSEPEQDFWEETRPGDHWDIEYDPSPVKEGDIKKEDLLPLIVEPPVDEDIMTLV